MFVHELEFRREADEYMEARAASQARFSALAESLGGADLARAELRRRAECRRVREDARRIGLAYWPALFCRDVDPAAYLAAEAVLSVRHGLYGPDGWGGWDSQGHHGLDPYAVACMWIAAGCRDSAKFRAQVASGVEARKGDTLPWFRDYARGFRWAEAWGYGHWLSRKALAVLGRLSPELRHAALRGVDRPGPVRVRDLNWAEAARVQALRADPSPRALTVRAVALPPRPAAVVLGLPHAARMPHPVSDERVPELCPAYPTVRLSVAARIAGGESPVQVSGGALTRAEAHEWLRLGGPDTADGADVRRSVVAHLSRGLPGLGGRELRDPAVARWLVHVHGRGAWSAMLKARRHPDGRALRYLDVIYEIAPEDLDRGVSTGVDRAFERAGERLANVDAEDRRTICRNPFGRLPKAMAVLTSPAALAHEGKAMGHCVGGYSRAVESGQCLILSICSRHGRSTVELRPGREWTVAQHQGHKNSDPPARHQQLLRAWLARINQTAARKAA